MPTEIWAYAVKPNGTRNRGFTIDGVDVLISGDDDEKIARTAGDLSEAASALERAEARRAEMQAEIERLCKLVNDLNAAVPPARPVQIMAPGCVRFDSMTGKLWLLSGQAKGWSAFGVILDDWDDLFRRFNVRVTGHGTDKDGAYWTVEAIAPRKQAVTS